MNVHFLLMSFVSPLDRKPITNTTPNLQVPSSRSTLQSYDFKYFIGGVHIFTVTVKIISLLSEVKCKCDFPECRKIMPETQRHAHLKFCEYRRIDCPYNCGESMIAKNLDVHKGYCRSLMQRGGKVMLVFIFLVDIVLRCFMIFRNC